MSQKLFFRVQHPQDLGLWYNGNAEFTNKIQELDLRCANLDMSYNEECANGFLSCTNSLDTLYDWFSREELLRLVDNGYKVLAFSAEEYKFHEKYKHFLFRKQGSLVIAEINLV